MKLSEIYRDLLEIAKSEGIIIRKDKGRFQSGYCIINGKETIILNSNLPLQVSIAVLANGLNEHSISNLYIKPALREYIDSQLINTKKENKFDIIID